MWIKSLNLTKNAGNNLRPVATPVTDVAARASEREDPNADNSYKEIFNYLLSLHTPLVRQHKLNCTTTPWGMR